MIPIAEIFYSIQGEGKFVGTPALFLRFAGCDVGCIWCDTKEVWMRGKLYNKENLIDLIKSKANKNIHLAITGGEPLIYNDFINELTQLIIDDFSLIEIETSATRVPYGFISKCEKVFFNTSPKLKNSFVKMEKRINKEAIEFFVHSNRAIFKFVVEQEEDIIEIIEDFIKPFKIPNQLVYLMPQSKNREEFLKLSPIIVELCKKYQFNFSPRLQLIIWDKATGV